MFPEFFVITKIMNSYIPIYYHYVCRHLSSEKNKKLTTNIKNGKNTFFVNLKQQYFLSIFSTASFNKKFLKY